MPQQNHGTNAIDVIKYAESITINGYGDELPTICDAVRNNTSSAGNVKVELDDGAGTVWTISEIPAGAMVKARIRKVFETGTSLATVDVITFE